MNYEIIELEEFSGRKAGVYSVIMEGDDITAYDLFIEENEDKYRKEVEYLMSQLKTIGQVTGAREQFFKLDEGKPGDGVCALYDLPGSSLRLFCVRYGATTIIVGGGGPKTVRAWQDDTKLDQEAKLMIQISKDIAQRIRDKEIYWSSDQTRLLGNKNFSDDETE